MAHRSEADEGFASSAVVVLDEDLASASASSVAATSTSRNGSSSSDDDVILVTGDDDLMPTLFLPTSSRVGGTVAAAAAAPSSSTLSSSNANKDAAVGATRETSDLSVVASSSSSASATASASASAESAAAAVLDCPICLQTCIHPARLPCGHIFCFLCVKGVAYKNRRCAMCRREIPAEFLDHPQLVNGIDDICTTKATDDGYQWFYEGRNGWWQYDDRTSQDIEDAYRKGDKSCTILVAGYVYIVDLEAMLQQRQNEPTRCRHVKRDLATIPKKGVAGLRIEGNAVATDSNFAASTQQREGAGGGSRSGAGADNDDDDEDEGVYTLRRRLLPTATSASDFISTIAATDAAIRIASDIIGSTLAHADEISRGAAAVSTVPASTATAASIAAETGSSSALAANTSGEQYSNSSGSIAAPHSSSYDSTSSTGRGSRELLGAAEDLLDATQSIISEADQRTIDLFEQTLNHFHALTLRSNVTNSSDEEEEENDADGNNLTNSSSAADGGHERGNGQMRF